jgi:hypothetical protein
MNQQIIFKKCLTCKKEKQPRDFTENNWTIDGYSVNCKECDEKWKAAIVEKK